MSESAGSREDPTCSFEWLHDGVLLVFHFTRISNVHWALQRTWSAQMVDNYANILEVNDFLKKAAAAAQKRKMVNLVAPSVAFWANIGRSAPAVGDACKRLASIMLAQMLRGIHDDFSFDKENVLAVYDGAAAFAKCFKQRILAKTKVFISDAGLDDPLPHGRIAFNVLAKAPNGRQTVPDTAVRCSFNISLDDLAFTGLVDNALCQLRDILRTNPFGEWEHYVYCPRPSADSVSILSRRVEKPPRASKKRPTPPPSAHPPPTPPTLPTPPTPPTPPPPPEPALPHTDKSASARALVERLHALARSAAQHGAKTEAAEAVAAARAMLARGDTEEAKAAGEWLGAALRKQMTVLCAKVDTKVVKK